MNRGLVSRAVFVFGFCLPLAAFGILAEESVEAEPQPWDRAISALVDRAGRATATDHALALGIWAVAILVGGAALVSMANSSRRRALFSVIGALFVIGYGFSLVYLGWSNPSGVVAGWCVSVAWV